MKKDSNSEIDIDARNLGDLVEQVRKISQIDDDKIEKKLVQELVISIHTGYKKEIEEEQQEPEEPGLLEKVKSFFGIKNSEENAIEAAKEAEARKIDEMEDMVFTAVTRLRSNQSIDSDQNDLNILKDMVQVVEIASNAQVPLHVQQEAARAVGRISTISGNSVEAVGQAKDQQQLVNDTQSLADSIRQNLGGNTSDVSFRPLMSQEHAAKKEAEYVDSANDLITKKRQQDASKSE